MLLQTIHVDVVISFKVKNDIIFIFNRGNKMSDPMYEGSVCDSCENNPGNNDNGNKNLQVIKRVLPNSKYVWTVWPNDPNRYMYTVQINDEILVCDTLETTLTCCFQAIESGIYGDVLDGFTVKSNDEEISLHEYIFDEDFKSQGLIAEEKLETIINDNVLVKEFIDVLMDEQVFVRKCPIFYG